MLMEKDFWGHSELGEIRENENERVHEKKIRFYIFGIQRYEFHQFQKQQTVPKCALSQEQPSMTIQ